MEHLLRKAGYMGYLADYYWQEGAQVSLLLKKVRHKRSNETLLLAGIFEEKQLCEEVEDWFYREFLRIYDRFGKRETAFRRVEESFQKLFENSRMQNPEAVCLCCIGQHFMLVKRGKTAVWFMNIGMRRNHLRKIEECFLSGSMEPGTELVLVTEGFSKNISAEQMEKCLGILQVEKCCGLHPRLRELAAEGERRGGSNMGAICIFREERA